MKTDQTTYTGELVAVTYPGACQGDDAETTPEEES